MELTLGLALVGLGFLLLLAQLGIPSGGLLFKLGLASIVVGVALTFRYDQDSGLITLIAVAVALPVVGGFLLHYWPKTPIGRRMIMTVPDEAAALLPAQLHLEQFRGRVGKTLSSLRPAGMVDFDGHRIDALTEGMMVDPGQWVRCIEVRGGKVIVRPVEKPPVANLENADFG